MSATMPKPDRSRQLALGLLVAAVLALICAIALPLWWAHHHYNVALDDAYGKLERYRRIASMRPEVTRQLEAMRAKDTRKFFLRSGAAPLSAAEAQEIIRGIIESSGGRLITMQALAPREEGRYRQVGINVQLAANIFALRKILHAVENNTPYLFVENLMVRTQVPGNFRPGPGAEPEMFMQFDIHGFSLMGSP